MKKKAIILDLDNTIYLVSSIGEKLFNSLFQLIIDSGDYTGDWNQLKSEIMRTPFQNVADAFHFGKTLKAEGIKLLADISYNDVIEPVESYSYIKKLSCKKFLVTTGFTKMQTSKIRQLDLDKDFDKIYVIDPSLSILTKKDVFEEILADNGYTTNEVLVVGDDISSEIKAGQELGIETVLFDFKMEYSEKNGLNVIRNFQDLELYL